MTFFILIQHYVAHYCSSMIIDANQLLSAHNIVIGR